MAKLDQHVAFISPGGFRHRIQALAAIARWRYLLASLASLLLNSVVADLGWAQACDPPCTAGEHCVIPGPGKPGHCEKNLPPPSPPPPPTIFVDLQNSGFQDGTAAHPFRTLPPALAVAAPGDTIAIRTGCYGLDGGPLVFNKSATVRADNGPVTITNAIQCVPPLASDIGPVFSDGNVGQTPSGRIIGIEGSDAAIYAISVDGGLWKATNAGPWSQLLSAPPLTFSLAVDPQNPSHLVVGERDGEGQPSLGRSGAWESTDAGSTWTKVFDSASQCPGASSQAVSSVQITPASTVLLGTSCGVWRKQGGNYVRVFGPAPILSLVVSVTTPPPFECPPPPSSRCPGPDDNCPPGCTPVCGHITSPGVVVGSTCVKIPPRTGGTVVVGRLKAGSLIYSLDEGSNWALREVPAKFTGSYDCYGFAGFPAIAPDPRDQTARPFFSSNSGLAAFGTIAVLTGCPNACPGNNSRLIYLDLLTGKAWMQQTTQGDGRGTSGGVRFFRTILNPAKPPVVGEGIDIFFSDTEEIQRATGVTTDAGNPVLAWGAPDLASQQDPIHGDVRSMTFDETTQAAWIADDGGVWRKKLGQVTTNQIEGLHTSSITQLSVLPNPLGAAPRLAYAGVDNGAWFGDLATGSWQNFNFGDASWTSGDAGDPKLIFLARSLINNAAIEAFSANDLNSIPKPPAPVIGISTNVYTDFSSTTERFYGATSLQMIQTPIGGRPSDLLDAVMLVLPPLFVTEGVAVNGPLGLMNPNPNGGPILLRNKQFASSPNINIQGLDTSPWAPEVTTLPVNTLRDWVSGGHDAGGHDNPVYYVYDNAKVYQLTKLPSGKFLTTDLYLGGANPLPVQLRVAWSPPAGPVFLDPYDPTHLFVLTDAGVMVSQVSSTGSLGFVVDDVLTALVTDSGRYRMTDVYSFTGELNGAGVEPLAGIGFNRDSSHSVVAGSPFTGVFWASGDARVWRSLAGAFHFPHMNVTDVGIDSEGIYVGTNGRGLLSISNYQAAPFASYYVRPAQGSITGTKLLRSDRKPLVGQEVAVTVTTTDGTQTRRVVWTAADGSISVAEPPPNSIVRLEFSGQVGLSSADSVAAAETAFISGH